MHIETGLIAQPKLILAGATAAVVLAYYLRHLIRRPQDWPRILLAALFFSVFMEAIHFHVGPSELHFVGAMAIYFTLGFLPALFGFALGLLLQALIFEPADLAHWAVNSLSLILPLLLVHYTIGRRYREQGETLTWGRILRLDAMYYSGVALMVGFWLAGTGTGISAWALWASSYALIVLIEPLVTYAAVRLLKAHEGKRLGRLFAVDNLRIASARQSS
ncbi:energy-coupling factor ABC transporter permease [Ectothiorhodospira lacustris]|uniref:energy-coupling factor ABC transporter permease n=1 Tax=Ectothiorhodospira TaxID=1051 RepID=UPI001EE7C081|nr:energy-coupling factor ABC transporter permease [Ectothiorhodospira lacustris]MCG5501563.1 energy-coupling factor ABC transporter permease [Ectothiorhodospira lacustris]